MPVAPMKRLLLAALTLSLTVCQTAPQPSPPVVLPPSGSPVPTATSIQPGGTLRVGLAQEIGSLDPGADEDAARPVTRQLYEGLVAHGAPGGEATGVLATKWILAADMRTWTFFLRSGVVFHDGTPLDAAIAATSLARRASDPVIESAKAADASTLVVVTRVPYGPFLSLLSTPAYAIVQPAAKNVGTGAFRIVPGTETVRPLVLERNPRYWRKDPRGIAFPYLDRITFTAYPDPAARVAALRSGAVDLVTEIPIADIATVRADPSLQLAPQPATTVLYLGLNLTVQPLDDLRVRRAIAQSINGRTLVDRLYAGEGRVASQFPPPGTLGYDDSVSEFAKYDLDAAKKLLADANNGSLDFSIWYVLGAPPSMPDARRAAETVAGELASAGIGAGLKTIDSVTFEQFVRDNKLGLWVGTATTRTGDADELLGLFFIPPTKDGQDQPTPGGAWVNAEVAGILRAARAQPDESKRAELYKAVSKIVQREVPRIPLVWSAPPAAATRKVLNVRSDIFTEVGMGK